MNVFTLLEKCRELGAVLTPLNDQLKIQAPEPLPNALILGLTEAKPEILAELRRERRHQAECWLLEEWRRISIPDWRKILRESIATGNAGREEYARWMLREILVDPEYQEVTN
jgi:hypothetical protein